MTTMAAAPEARNTLRLAPLLCGDVLPLVLLALLVTATRGIWFGDPVADFDEQLYSFIGWRMGFGELPFVDWWDRKPFGLFAIFGFAHALFGPEPLAYQAIAAFFAFAGAVLTYFLARRLVGRMSATITAAISTILLCAYSSYSAQSEVFFLPMILGMATLLVDAEHPHFTRRAFIAMLLGGIALQVKYTVLPQCVFFGLYALWVEYRRSPSIARSLGLAAGFALLGLLPTLAIGAYYAMIGELDAYVFANFYSFFDRTPAPQGRWSDEHWIGTSPIAILVLLGTYAAIRVRRPEPIQVWHFYCGWAIAALLTVLLPGTVYLYYYAALSAPAALVALPLLDRRGALRAAPGLVLAGTFFTLLDLPDRYHMSLEQRAAASQLAAVIRPHVNEETDCLWLWDGPTALYRMTRSCVPTRYVYPDHLNNALETDALEGGQTAEVARILATRPGAIVTADRPMTYQNPEATALVEQVLAAEYEARTTVKINNRLLTAWIRRD